MYTNLSLSLPPSPPNPTIILIHLSPSYIAYTYTCTPYARKTPIRLLYFPLATQKVEGTGNREQGDFTATHTRTSEALFLAPGLRVSAFDRGKVLHEADCDVGRFGQGKLFWGICVSFFSSGIYIYRILTEERGMGGWLGTYDRCRCAARH